MAIRPLSRFRSRIAVAPAVSTSLVLFVALFGCQSSASNRTGESAPHGASAIVARVDAPAVTATEALQLPGLHNVVTYAPNVVGGGVPEGTEGFETLAAMGIKTIVSVDGAQPDVEQAKRFGLRYIHLPISYDTVTPERQAELAQVLANAEQPVYVHCHHGKHRSAAALGTAIVCAGLSDPDTAQQRMQVSGTAPNYKGLWRAVAEAKPLPATALAADVSQFPAIAKVSGLVGTMAEIDLVFDLVKQAEQAGWQAPSDHPDLVATKETKRLATLFDHLRRDPESQALPADYQRLLQQSIELTQQLDEAVRGGQGEQAKQLLTAVNKGCKECSAIYRDQ